MNEVLKYDKNFTESKFKTYADNIFIQLHLALVTKELENIRHFVSKEVYDIYENKLNDLNTKGLTQMYDEINVAQTDIVNYQIKDNMIIIEVNLISRYLDYLIDENGNYVSGDTDVRTEKLNHLTFTKKINNLSQGIVRKCSGCGASIDVNNTGICEYCGTTYNLEDKDFILSKIEN